VTIGWWSMPVVDLLGMMQEVADGAHPSHVISEAYANGVHDRDGDGSMGYVVLCGEELMSLLGRAVVEDPDALLSECLERTP